MLIIRAEFRLAAGATRPRSGFTLVELLVVIAIIGILVALLMPAVQSAREAARRTQCSNNMRQLAIAARSYETATRFFPPAHSDYGNKEICWMTLLLPYVEQQALYDAYDFKQKWNHANNKLVKETNLSVQHCPSAEHAEKGLGDYAGINGTRALPGMSEGYKYGQSYTIGMLLATGPTLDVLPVRASMVRDGLSNTLMIGESAGRTDSNRFWVDAHQSFAQHGLINKTTGNEMYSFHPGGVMTAFADGSIRFLNENLEMTFIDAISSRARGEVIDASRW